MSPDLLRGPHLKLQRAERHLAELNEVLAAFVNDNAYTIRVDAHTDPKWLQCIVPPSKELPEYVPTIIGDLVHNLNSAFDHLAVLLVKPKCSILREVQFPFCKAKNSLAAEIAKRHIKSPPVHPDAIKLIHRIAPYKHGGGHVGLYEVHELDIRDKHRLILAISRTDFFIRILDRPHGFTTQPIALPYVAPGQNPITFPFEAGPNLNVGDHIKPVMGIFFDKEEPLAGRAVISSLRILLNKSRVAIDAFEPFV